MSTSGLRAVNVGFILGFKKFRFYGMDSCLIDREKRVGQGKVQNTHTWGVRCGDKIFQVNGGMGKQAEEFQNLYDIFPDDISIDVRGEGLLAAIVEERKREGFRT